MQADEDERMVDKRAASRMNGEGADDPSANDGGAATADGGSNQSPEQELATAKEQAENNYKSWQRTAADFQNYKRRVEQERGEAARFASAALVINMLPVYDDLDRAVNVVDAHLAGLNWVQGVIAIQRKFALLLEAMGVKELSPSGEAFDPERHEAVGNQPGAEGMVLHVVQKGYMLGEKVIRPAMVIVGQRT
ncbi:MAG: nucleotide exchange factor GrpE [Anaerolineaceae bacterium]